MHVGVVFPTTEIGVDPEVISGFAESVEALGYDYLLTYDHVVGAEHLGREGVLPGPYDHRDPFHEPFVLFGFLAGRTRRLGLATGVLVLPQRQTVLVAKQAAELDLLSAGRLRLGVGLGWNPVEYESLGVPWAGRAARLEHQVALIRRLWSEELVVSEGPYDRVDRAAILPRPARTVPIWLAVTGPRSARRAGRIADGGIFPTADEPMAELIAIMRSAAAQAGRSPQEVGAECLLDVDLGQRLFAEAVDRWTGAGGTHLCVRSFVARSAPRPGSRARSVAQHLDALSGCLALTGAYVKEPKS